jgi:hypothetical protein
MGNIRNSETILQMPCCKNTDHWSWGWISYIEDVFGFTAKSIHMEVWLGRDNLSAALYRINVSMRITPDVTGVLVVWLLVASLQQTSVFGTKSTVSELKTSFVADRPSRWPLWRKVHQPFCSSVLNISVESLTVAFTQDVLGSNIDPKTRLHEGVFCISLQTHQPLPAPLNSHCLTLLILIL